MVPLGKRFQLARKRQNITLEQASTDLKIRPEFLQALEKGAYSNLPSAAYTQGFVGNYAHYLGLPKNESIAMFRREFDEKKVYSVLPQSMTRNAEFKVKRLRLQQTGLLILAVFLIIGGYLLYQYRYAFLSPPLEVITPKENEIIKSNTIQISGKSDPNATVMVNTNTVSVDSQGNFSKQIDLFSGKTIIQISATNRFGKKSIIQRTVEVKPE